MTKFNLFLAMIHAGLCIYIYFKTGSKFLAIFCFLAFYFLAARGHGAKKKKSNKKSNKKSEQTEEIETKKSFRKRKKEEKKEKQRLLGELKRIKKIKNKKLRELKTLQLQLSGKTEEKVEIEIKNKYNDVPKCPICGRTLYKRAGKWVCMGSPKCSFSQKIKEED